jgi:hypothetical protein
MSLDIQFKINSTPVYKQYIRTHSNWYKILNRNSNMFKVFESRVKEEYNLRTTDKIKRTLDTIELVQNLLTTFK